MTDERSPEEIPHDIGGVLKMAQLSERIGALDERTGTWHRDHETKLSNLFRLFHGQRQAFAAHDGLPEAVHDLAEQFAAHKGDTSIHGAGGAGGGEAEEVPDWLPKPTLLWWEKFDHPDQDPAKRDQLLAERRERLLLIAGWIQEMWVPGYGYMARMLPACWQQHMLLVHILDTMTEMWRTLYLNPKRGWNTLREQAEFQTRYVPAWVKQMELEAEGCVKAKQHVPSAKSTEPRDGKE